MSSTPIIPPGGTPPIPPHWREESDWISSPVNKAEFLRLLQSNDATACEEFEIFVPDPSEIEAAQPIARVLPMDVMRQVTVIAVMLFGGELDTIQ
jgi:hypothetical protein